jgi:hypothetical protein
LTISHKRVQWQQTRRDDGGRKEVMRQQLWQQTRGNGLVALASRQVMQGNSVEVVMAAADKRWWHTRAEARTTAEEKKGSDGG